MPDRPEDASDMEQRVLPPSLPWMMNATCEMRCRRGWFAAFSGLAMGLRGDRLPRDCQMAGNGQ